MKGKFVARQGDGVGIREGKRGREGRQELGGESEIDENLKGNGLRRGEREREKRIEGRGKQKSMGKYGKKKMRMKKHILFHCTILNDTK